MSCRRIDPYCVDAIGFSKSEFEQLEELATRHHDSAWDLTDKSPLTNAEKTLVRKFKHTVKEHLYLAGQGPYCCYCGLGLADHQATYDAEHCIAKVGKTNLVFNLRNIAIACKSCNGRKHDMRVRVFPLDDNYDDVSEGSDKYLIVHPHFDEWKRHLGNDKYGRVVVVDGSGLTKGHHTFQSFEFHKKNAMALADHFDIFRSSAAERKEWIAFYVQCIGGAETTRRKKYVAFLSKVLALPGSPASEELLDVLELTKPPTA